MSTKRWYTTINAPFGRMYIVADTEAVQYIGLEKPFFSTAYSAEMPLLNQTADRVKKYINGDAKEIILPCQTVLSPFQKAVFDEVGRIAYGKTATYEEIATAIGKPYAVKAVMHTCLSNPLWIVFPTHRITITRNISTAKDQRLKAAEALRRMEQRYLDKP